MASVSQLIDGIAQALDYPRDQVNKYARALIDAGLLPKSRGRAVAQIELVHFVRLLTAIALEPKIKDTASRTSEYLALPMVGRHKETGNPVYDDEASAEDGLLRLFSVVLAQGLSGELAELQKLCIEGTIQFVTNFSLIEVAHPAPRDIGGTLTTRYKPKGERMDLDGAHIRRSTIIRADLATLVAIKIDPANWSAVFGEAA